jgi:nucleoid DNA-binding protein
VGYNAFPKPFNHLTDKAIADIGGHLNGSNVHPLNGGEGKMNKGDLINEVAKIVSTKKQAQEIVDCVFTAISDAMQKNEPVQIAGFGTFKTSMREARMGRNPQTGAEIKIDARMVPKFVPAKALKDNVK